jgi:hypothetical protein
LRLTGTAGLAKEQWTGTFDLASGDHPLGQIALHNDGLTGSGGLTIDTGILIFAQGGLQPLDLSPLVAGFVSPPVTGQARFTGRFDWTPDAQTSSGVVTIPGLDFVSPVGDAKGLKGEVAFTSLVPLMTAPNQIVTLDSLAAVDAPDRSEARLRPRRLGGDHRGRGPADRRPGSCASSP